MPDMPEWVHVWWWLRVLRDPHELTSLPQQKPYVDETETMSVERYEKLRAEWLEAGAPRRASELLTRLPIEEVEVPF